MIKRYLGKHILESLKDKMVFISGPRQVGKTTLACEIGRDSFQNSFQYLNWDNRSDRKTILSGVFQSEKQLLIFDEIHKYKNWKGYLKGEYDQHKEEFHFLITGSARLDTYRKGGDSLLGRYHSYRLHPLSLAELLEREPSGPIFKELSFHEASQNQKLFQSLFQFGGFPEIYVKQNERILRRWHNERVDRLIKEDIRDIENLRDLSALQVLVELLPEKVGSLLSLNALREDLNVAHKTITLWVEILERFYYHFRIYPFQSNRIKSLRKEAKLYLWDWSELKDENARIENIVASHLLKFVHFLYDIEGYKAELRYLRDKEQREVDFVVSIDRKPWFCVEVKTSYKGISTSLNYFSSKLRIPYTYQIVKEENVDFIKDHTRTISASKFLSGLA